MVDTKLTNLTAASALSTSDLFYVVQSSTSKKATGLQIQDTPWAFSNLGGTTLKPTASACTLITDPTGVTGNGGVTWNASYLPVAWTNGPGGQTNYIDDVYCLGLNVSTSGARVDATKSALYQQWESKFYQSSTFGSEFHTELITSSGTSLRPDYSFYPSDGGAGSTRTISCDTLVFDKLTGSATAPFQLDNLNKTWTLNASAVIRGGTNNVALTSQLNAAGNTYVNGPYLNASDVWQFGKPLQSAAAVTSSIPGYYFVASSVAANSTFFKAEGGTVTGGVYGIQLFTSATTDFMGEIRNQNSASSTARAIFRLTTAGASTGDPIIQYCVATDTPTWCHGIDNSDSDKWKLSASSALGTSDILTFDSAGLATFTGAVLLPAGTAANPALTFTGTPTYGFSMQSGNVMWYSSAGTNAIRFAGNSLWISDVSAQVRLGTTPDNRISTISAGVLQFGDFNSASPSAQTIQAQGSRTGTDTDVAGASFTIASGKGTGNATGSSLIFQTPAAVASGTGAQTMTTALTLNGSQQALFSSGSSSAPTISFVSTSTTGFYLSGTTNTVYAAGTQNMVSFNQGAQQLKIHSGISIAWTSTTDSQGTSDLFLLRGAAATLQLGAAAAATPVAQTLQAQGSRAGTDSNVGGAGLTITSGNGTGTGTISTLTLQSPVAVASGTGAQTQTTGLRVNKGTAVLTAYTVATLPATPLTGAMAYVTDALAPAFLTAVVGGGAIVTPVFYDGTNWKAF